MKCHCEGHSPEAISFVSGQSPQSDTECHSDPELASREESLRDCHALRAHNDNLKQLMYKCLCVITLFFFMACSSEKPSQPTKPPVSQENGPYSLQIIPQNPTRSSTLYLITHGFNPSDAKIEWSVNGSPSISPVPNQFKAIEAKKGDKIQVIALIKGKKILSNIVQIKNSPPEISKIKITPEVLKTGDNLGVEVTVNDIDGDEVTIFYEWTKNGEPAGNSKQIEVPLKRGDQVDIKITSFDGEAYSHSVILHREIKNMPPTIIEDMKFSFDGKIYTYQVKAIDPDGDNLTYSIKSSPSNMTINPSTGLVKWDVPPGFKGKAPVDISVTDGHGGEASQSLTIIIGPEIK